MASRIVNALEVANYSAAPLHKYIREMDDCFDQLRKFNSTTSGNTLGLLSRYLDRQKFKKK